MKNTNDSSLYSAITLKELPNCEVEITGEITLDAVKRYRNEALASIKKDFELPGFRKGNVPETLVLERMGEPRILAEVAERALQSAYPAILKEKDVDAVGQPDITLTKLAPGNPIGFSIKTAVFPTIVLPDYKALAKECTKETLSVSMEEKEVQDIIDQVRKNFSKDSKEEGAGKSTPLPELTDEMVQHIGNFKTVEEFKKHVEQNIRAEKMRKAREARRVEIGEKIITSATIPLPEIFIKSETEKMLSQLKADTERMGLTFENYLKEIKKDEAGLREEWRPLAEKRARLQLALSEIARKEKIEPKTEAVAQEVERVLQHVKDADKQQVELYVRTMLSNEAVFAFLESTNASEKKAE